MSTRTYWICDSYLYCKEPGTIVPIPFYNTAHTGSSTYHKNLVYVEKKQSHYQTTRAERALHHMYFYEQDGCIYEFFTGKCLGSRNNTERHKIEGTDILLTFSLYNTEYSVYDKRYGERPSAQVTADVFADSIKQHLDKRMQIAKLIEEFFEQHHNNWLRKQNNQETKNVAISQAEKWLDTLIY